MNNESQQSKWDIIKSLNNKIVNLKFKRIKIFLALALITSNKIELIYLDLFCQLQKRANIGRLGNV